MPRPNLGYYTEKLDLCIRADLVEKIDELVNQKNHYRNRQDVVREAIEQYIERLKRVE